jgi:hypothetical protein
VHRRREDEDKDKARAPGDDRQREEEPTAPPRRSTIIRRGNGHENDMGDWVIDDLE